MKRKLVSLLLAAVLLLSMIPTAALAGTEEPVQFILDNAWYTNGQSSLTVTGHYVNLSNRQLSDVVETYIEVYDGGSLVAQGTYKKVEATTYSMLPGGVQKADLVIENPTKLMKLKNLTASAKVTYNSADPVVLPAGKKVYYNGSPITFDVKPAIISGRLMVPARATFEKMGAQVEWNPDAKSITVRAKENTVVLFIGDKVMTSNGKPFALDAPAQIIDGRTVVPLRAISDALGCKVLYGTQNEIVAIYTVN